MARALRVVFCATLPNCGKMFPLSRKAPFHKAQFWRTPVRLPLIACLLFAIYPRAADAQQKDTEDYIAAGWKRIVKTQADYALKGTEQLDSERVSLYWAQIRAACVKEFDKTLEIARSRNEIDRFAEAYVKRFGTEGPQADIRWAFASCGVLFVNRGGALKGYEDLVEPFSTHLVEECLASPAYYQRLYWFRMWAGDARNRKSSDGYVSDSVGLQVSLCRDTINAPPGSGSYQFGVTRFLMLAYLCNWEDNFSDFAPPGNATYFRRKFAQFEVEYLHDAHSMRFDKKEYRFHKSRVPLVPGWLVEHKLPAFEAPPIPFPDAKPFPLIPKHDGPGWDDMRYLLRF